MKALLFLLWLIPSLSLCQDAIVINTNLTRSTTKDEYGVWTEPVVARDYHTWMITYSDVVWYSNQKIHFTIRDVEESERGIIYKCEGKLGIPVWFVLKPGESFSALWLANNGQVTMLTMDIDDN